MWLFLQKLNNKKCEITFNDHKNCLFKKKIMNFDKCQINFEKNKISTNKVNKLA